MRHGDWQQNGEAIKFDADGRLRDGQHRLRAILEAGVTLELLVIDGLPTKAQETMDIGVRRTFADLLALRGEGNRHVLAATLGVIFRLRSKTLGSLVPGDQPTHHELLRLLEQEPVIREYLQRGRAVSERVAISATLAAGLWYELSRIDEEDAARFFEALTKGQGLQEGDPVFALRRYLERDRAAKRNRSRYQIAGVVVKAWNYWRQGITVRSLSFRAGGANAEAFPAIDGMVQTALPASSSGNGRPSRRSGPGAATTSDRVIKGGVRTARGKSGVSGSRRRVRGDGATDG
jgi:hypothetical protein